MDSNAWKSFLPNEYDAHMSHPNVFQTQTLNFIIKEQLALIPLPVRKRSCAAILGITNGNGLEHATEYGHIIGIDINNLFLGECRARHDYLAQRLSLFNLDLVVDLCACTKALAESDIIIANLVIEHVHLDNFIRLIASLPKRKRIVSCVIQVNPDGAIASSSGVEHVFNAVVAQAEQENEASLCSAMQTADYQLTNRDTYCLPNGKCFVRLDFSSH